MNKKKLFVVLPAYNEGTQIISVIDEIKKSGFENIIVVNDGSTDNTEEILKKTGVIFLSHLVNRGAGAATQTGISFALELGADIVVTMDSDGQHYPEDISKIIKPIIEDGFDFVIGSRFLEVQKIPFIRKIFNKIGNFITWFFFGSYVTDSQSGFKAFHKNALNKFEIESNGFEFCSEIIQKIHVNNINFTEIPISVKYTEYSQSKGQNFMNGVKTFLKLAIHSLIK